jgi:hypothetical protein
MCISGMFKKLFDYPSRLSRKVDEVDRESREVKHTLRNLAMRSNALHRLVTEMREDETWRRPDEGRR